MSKYKRKNWHRGLCLGLLCTCLTLSTALTQAAPAPEEHFSGRTVNQPNVAARELERDANRVEQTRPLTVSISNLYVPRAQVTVEGNSYMSEQQIRSLLPELEKEEINVRKLSMQLQLANSSGAAELAAKLVPQAEGRFAVRIVVQEKKREHVVETVTNGGNTYTGDWRMITSYVNTNLTGYADTLGVSYVTSPGHWDDVKQAAFSYRSLLPRAAGEVNVFAGWSDVDLGTIYSQAGMTAYAGGRSYNFGMNYVQHLSYSTQEKDSWEFGFEHKNYTNEWGYSFLTLHENFAYDYNIDEFSVRFRHQERRANRFFGWQLGVLQSVGGDAEDYRQGTRGSDSYFTIFRGGAQYQYRTKGDWLLSGHVMGQYTAQNLISPEQLGVGGMNNTLRGFNERTLNADCGLLGTVEVYTPELAPHLRALAFTDMAAMHNNNNSLAYRNEGVATAGLGLRYTDRDNGLYVSLDYVAKFINDIDENVMAQPGHKRWNLVLTKVF